MNTKQNTLPLSGQRVGVVDGPGQSPARNAGAVICHVVDRWGTHALIMMDSGKTKTCHSLMFGPGIGFHVL